MAGPFFNAIKGTTSGTPGTGAFTPNAASSGYLAWSTVPAGWIGLVRFVDGAAWEHQYSYWNGTTLSRSATAQFVSSSTGSALTLTSAATAAMVEDGNEIAPHIGVPFIGWLPNLTTGGFSTFGSGIAAVVTGTGAAAALATTNFLTEQPRSQVTSATTANAQAGLSATTTVAVVNTTSGRGGGEFTTRFGASALPTGPRLLAGLTTVTFVGSAGEPSALAASFAGLLKDSTDTNLQFGVKDGTTASKTDTGIPLAANGWYEATTWWNSGSNTFKLLLLRLDTGAIYYGSTSTNTPLNGSLLLANVVGGLSATTGTAIVMQIGGTVIRPVAG